MVTTPFQGALDSYKQKHPSLAKRAFSAARKLAQKLSKSKSAASLSDHWMKLVSVGSITAGIMLISVPAALITFGVLFLGLETVTGKLN